MPACQLAASLYYLILYSTVVNSFILVFYVIRDYTCLFKPLYHVTPWGRGFGFAEEAGTTVAAGATVVRRRPSHPKDSIIFRFRGLEVEGFRGLRGFRV